MVQTMLRYEISEMLGWSGLWAADSACCSLRDRPLRRFLRRPFIAPLRSSALQLSS